MDPKKFDYVLSAVEADGQVWYSITPAGALPDHGAYCLSSEWGTLCGWRTIFVEGGGAQAMGGRRAALPPLEGMYINSSVEPCRFGEDSTKVSNSPSCDRSQPSPALLHPFVP